MKLLFDQNLSSQDLIERLDDLWPGSRHVRDRSVGLIDADYKTYDDEIFDYAGRHGLAVVTTDKKDFLKLSRERGHPPKVILMPTGNCGIEEIERILRERYRDLLAFHNNERAAVFSI